MFFKNDILMCMIFAAFTIFAEVLIIYGNIPVSFVVNLLFLISLILMTYFKYLDNSYALYLSLTIIPLIRIISIAIPVNDIPEPYKILAISIPMLFIGITIADILDLKSAAIGFYFTKIHKQLLVILIGLPLGFIGYLINKPFIKNAAVTPAEIILKTVVFLLCTGLIEEFLFRGILLNVILNLQGEKRRY